LGNNGRDSEAEVVIQVSGGVAGLARVGVEIVDATFNTFVLNGCLRLFGWGVCNDEIVKGTQLDGVIPSVHEAFTVVTVDVVLNAERFWNSRDTLVIG
jgi:hypothetical protein